MVLLDDRILELFHEDDTGIMSPSEIAADERILHSAGYVSRRCKKLEEYGLLKLVSKGVYKLTEQGEEYLKGEYNTQDEAEITIAGDESAD
jgi:Mn-dependent DtxR family transcriptional regulator